MKKRAIFYIALPIVIVFVFKDLIFLPIYSCDSKNQVGLLNYILKNNGLISAFSESGKRIPFAQNEFNIDSIKYITSIRAEGVELSKSDFKNLVSLDKLKTLVFSNTKLEGDVFGTLPQEKLREISFHHGDLSSEIGISLKRFNRFDTLMIGNMNISEEFYSSCSGLNINGFLIKDTPITVEQLTAMLPLEKLEFASLENTAITEDIAEWIDKCPSLRDLWITRMDMNCSFLQNIKERDKIRSFYIWNTNLDDSIIPSLKNYKNLKELSILFCKVTEKSVPLLEELSKTMYSITVITDGETIFEHRNSDNY